MSRLCSNHFPVVFLLVVCLIVSSNLQAALDFTFTKVCENLITSFQAPDSVNGEKIDEYYWDFQNDGIIDDSGAVVSYTYSSDGTFDCKLSVLTEFNNSFFKQKNVEVYDKPIASVSGKNQVCQYENETFTAPVLLNSGFVSSYNWDLDGNGTYGDGNAYSEVTSFPVYGDFDVSVIVVTNKGCSDTATLGVEVNLIPFPDFELQNICDGDLTQFSNLSTANDSIIGYSWDFGDSTSSALESPSHSYASYGTYDVQLEIYTNKNCTAETGSSIKIYPVPQADFVVQDVCLNVQSAFFNSTYFNNIFGEVVSYEWQFGDGENKLSYNAFYTYQNSGDFQATLIAETPNCKDSVTQEVTVFSLYPFSINSTEGEEICDKSSTDLYVDPGDNQIQWSTGALDSSITISLEDWYAVTITDSNSCNSIDSVFIAVNPQPTLEYSGNTQISLGETVELFGFGAETYQWVQNEEVDEGLGFSYNPTEDQTIMMIGTDEKGCKDSLFIDVFVNKDFKLIPMNLMTPNADGANDTWIIENIWEYPDCKVQIFNEWGQTVFETEGYQNDFDGIYDGKPLPEGSYYYHILCQEEEKEWTGGLTIVRPEN